MSHHHHRGVPKELQELEATQPMDALLPVEKGTLGELIRLIELAWPAALDPNQVNVRLYIDGVPVEIAGLRLAVDEDREVIYIDPVVP